MQYIAAENAQKRYYGGCCIAICITYIIEVLVSRTVEGNEMIRNPTHFHTSSLCGLKSKSTVIDGGL